MFKNNYAYMFTITRVKILKKKFEYSLKMKDGTQKKDMGIGNRV